MLSLLGGSAEVSTLRADRVIAATGYAVDVRRMRVLEPSLREAVEHVRRAPKLSSTFESTVPGLFMVGLAAAPTFGPVMRFVHGAGFAARSTTRGLVRAVRGSAKAAPVLVEQP